MADGSRSSSAALSPANTGVTWLRWILPSVADLLFVAILAALVCTSISTRLLNDAGVGWHIRTGQFILNTHGIPRVDPFSSQAGKPWIAWEWLYDAAVGLLESKLGLNGVVWFTAVIIAAVFAWTFKLTLLRGTNLVIALVLTLLAISASMIHFLTRPHVVSWFFALAWFWILDSTESRSLLDRNGLSRRWLWFLPLSTLIWVNVHGGFLLGFALLTIFWLASLWTWLRTKENRIEESFQKIAAGKRARELTVIGIISAAATFVNPYGWKLHEHILSYLSNRFLMGHIDEFQSPNFHGVAQRCFLILLLISIAAIAVRRRQLRASELLVVLLAVYAALYAARNIPISSILLVLIVGPRLCSTRGSAFVQRMSAINSGARGHLWPIAASIVVFLIAVNGGRLGSQQVLNAHFDAGRMPVEAVNYLEQGGIKSPIFGPDYWGGYLIYRLYPHTKVVIDDRHDFYGEAFLREYLKAIHLEAGWDLFLKNHEAACLVLPQNSPLTQILLQTPGWSSIYADPTAVIFIPGNNQRNSGRTLGR